MGYPTQQQKVDFVFKKLGFTKAKTGVAEDQTSGFSGDTKKAPPNEAIASPLVVPASSVWADSQYIPSSPPTSSTAYVGIFTAGNAYRMTYDNTVSNERTFIARSTAGNQSASIDGDWIDTQFGTDYLVKVYKGDPNAGGTNVGAAGSGANDTWFFDYSAGILNFNGEVDVAGVGTDNVYILGYRYLGTKGVQPGAGIGTFTSLDISGIATFRNDVQFHGVNAGVTSAYWDKSDNEFKFVDSAKLSFGTGQDLSLYHNATDSFIKNSTNKLKVLSDKFRVNNTADNKSLIFADDGGAVKLYYDGAIRLETTGIGVSILASGVGAGETATIAGPPTLILDPDTVGVNTGTVRIKGDLIVDGEQTVIKSTALEIADFIVGIASTATTDILADGAGIKIGPDNTLLYDHSSTSLKVNNDFNIDSGKVYKINDTNVLSSTTLGSGVVNSRLTTVDTLNHLKVAGISTFVNPVSIASSLNVSGVATITTLNVGTTGQSGLVGITTILDEDNMASDSNTALATQQSIKKYIDDNVTAQDLDVSDGSTPIDIDLDSETLTIAGTANQIHTVASGTTITVGLTTDVTIGDDLIVTGDIASVTNVSVTGLSTFTGNIDANGALDVDGQTDLDVTRISEGLNVTAGIATFAGDIDANADIELAGNLAVTGISTFTGSIDANGSIDVDGQTELDDVNVSGITTTKNFNVGTTGQSGLVGITTILDEDNMASDSATALATQQSIKKYVDDNVTAQDLDFQADSGGALSIDLDSEVLGILGTTNEIETSGSGNNVTIGLPDNVNISQDLDVGANAGIGSLAVSGVSTFSNYVGLDSGLRVAGVSTFVGVATFTTNNVYISQSLYVGGLEINPGTGGTSTFGIDIVTRNLLATGIVTVQDYIHVGSSGTVFASNPSGTGVGINSTSPVYMLDVGGIINSNNDVLINGTSVLTSSLNEAVAMAIALG